MKATTYGLVVATLLQLATAVPHGKFATSIDDHD